jgi:hypothetical protein
MGTFGTTIIVIDSNKEVALTMVCMGVEDYQYLSDSTQYSYSYDHKSCR